MRFQKIKFKSKDYLHILAYIVFFLVFFFLFLVDLKPQKHVPMLGETASKDIVIPYDFTFEDKEATKKFRIEEQSKVKKQYKIDPLVKIRVEHRLNKIFDCLYKKDKKTFLANYGIDPKKLSKLFGWDYNRLLDLRNRIFSFMARELKKGISEDVNFNQWARDIPNNIKSIEGALKIIEIIFETNLTYDKESTENLKRKAIASVIPVYIKIHKGEILVKKGDIVDKQSFNIMKMLGLYHGNRGTLKQKAGIFSFLTIILLIGYLYIYYFEKELILEKQIFFLVLTLMGLNMIAVKVFKVLLNSKITMENLLGSINVLSPAAFPMALVVILVSVLVNGRLAILIGVFLSTLAISQLGIKFYYIYYFLFSSFFSVYITINATKSTELAKKGLLVSLINMITIFTLYMIFEDPVYYENNYWIFISRDLFWSFFNGIISIALAIGFLPYFESTFKLSSSMRFLEFADLNQPLLQRLMIEAPGTYQHSIVVGTLAEAAARALDINPLLAKIGGYYHDIGKLKRPYFFSENMISDDNRHDDLNPSISALIISSHPKDGAEIAKKNKLPDEIVDIIKQHHGTTLIQYFYEIAKSNSDNSSNVEDGQYRYPGPLPDTKEAAAVMLADSVESATRSLENPNASSIEAIVKKVINDKFVSGQFNNCNLTLKDIDILANIFIKMLITMYHSRIKYPEQDKEMHKMMEKLNELRN